MVSLWCELLCKLSIYTLKSDQWITIWWGKFELKWYLIYSFILKNFKIQSHLQKRRNFNTGISKLIPKKTKSSKISNTTSAILLFFFHKKYFNLIVILSTLESTSLNKTIKCALKWFILTQRMRNLEFVNLKCVTYAQPIPLPLRSTRSNDVDAVYFP